MFKDCNPNSQINVVILFKERTFLRIKMNFRSSSLTICIIKDTFYYFPRGDEIIIENTKKPSRSLRRIYMNTKFTQFEIKG